MNYLKERTINKNIWHRLKSSDAVDWLFGLLFLAIGAIVVAVVITTLNDHGHTPVFNAISYEVPAQVVNNENTVPSIAGLPEPSITVGDKVPVRLTRVSTCDTNECPRGGIEIIVSIRWQALTNEGTNAGRSFVVLDQFETSLEENTDYVVDAFALYTNQLIPFTFPEAVEKFIEEENLSVSAWRIEGVTEPLVPNAVPAAWSTEVFHVVTEEVN